MRRPSTAITAVGFIAAVAAAAMPFASAPRLHASEGHHTVVRGDTITWGPGPPSLPPGAQGAVLLGNPAKEGPFVLRLKLPAGFVVPPHRHSKDEILTVISGHFAVTAGEQLDKSSLQPMSLR